jgi:hypothetical protein
MDKRQNYLLLKQVVHIVTTVFLGLKCEVDSLQY